jgi:hypothetical protein
MTYPTPQSCYNNVEIQVTVVPATITASSSSVSSLYLAAVIAHLATTMNKYMSAIKVSGNKESGLLFRNVFD